MYQNSGNIYSARSIRTPNKQPGSIKAGLSVQELKAMTAMRLAHENQHPHGYSVNPSIAHQASSSTSTGVHGSERSYMPEDRRRQQMPQYIVSESRGNVANAGSYAPHYSHSGNHRVIDPPPTHGAISVEAVKELTKKKTGSGGSSP